MERVRRRPSFKEDEEHKIVRVVQLSVEWKQFHCSPISSGWREKSDGAWVRGLTKTFQEMRGSGSLGSVTQSLLCARLKVCRLHRMTHITLSCPYSVTRFVRSGGWPPWYAQQSQSHSYREETAVCTINGFKMQVLSWSPLNHGGKKISEPINKHKHLNAVVLTTIVGNVLPSISIFAGTNVMKRWFDSLRAELEIEKGDMHFLKKEGSLAVDAFYIGRKNLSMSKTRERGDHIFSRKSRKARAEIRARRRCIPLVLDWASSWNRCEWLRIAHSSWIEVVQDRNNMSTCLQPKRLTGQKLFKRGVCHVQDTIAAVSLHSRIHPSSLKWVTAFKAIITDVVKRSFEAISLWLIDMRFLEMAEAVQGCGKDCAKERQ